MASKEIVNKNKFEIRKLFTPYLLLLYLAIAVGTYLRLQGVFTNSFAYTYDVGRDLLAVRDIIVSHDVSLIGPTTGIPGVFYGPWWYLLLSPFFLVFNGNPAGIAFAMAIVGVATIILSYIVGKKIGGEFMGVATASLVAVSPELIAISSQIWNPNIAPFFVLLIFLPLIQIFTNKDKPIHYFVLGIILFLMVDLEIIFGLFFAVGTIVSVLIFKKAKMKLFSILAFVLGSLVILLPRIIFELRHDFLMTQSFIKYFAGGAESHRVDTNIIAVLQNRLDVFLNEFSYTLTFGNKIVGGLLLFASFIAIVYLYKKILELERKIVLTIGIIMLTFFLGTTFFAHDIWPHYLVGLPILYVSLVAIALSSLRLELNTNLAAAVIVAVLFITNLNPINILSNINKPIWEGDASVYRNQVAVVDYVYKDAVGKEFKYVVYTPPVHDYTYQYLFDYLGENKYSYLPSVQANTAYFILEPDSDMSRRERWIEDRKDDGKIISTKKIKGGIIVQKRLVNYEKE